MKKLVNVARQPEVDPVRPARFIFTKKKKQKKMMKRKLKNKKKSSDPSTRLRLSTTVSALDRSGSEFDRRRSKKPGKTKQKKLGKHRFFRRRAIERGGEATVMEHR